MIYTLSVRALFDMPHKGKAAVHAERLFPHLSIHIVGKYYKDDSLWEATACKDFEYLDDKTALWETLAYFGEIQQNWLILTGPNPPDFETVVSAVAENHDQKGLTWCSYELLRKDQS